MNFPLRPVAMAVAVALAHPVLAQQAVGDADVATLKPVIVSANPLALDAEQAAPVTVLDRDDLVQRRRATLGELLDGEPGVHADTFGGGASRPVIRGQTAPRVRVLSDGSEVMDASAVSPDHVVTVDTLLARRVELLRGPSALLYGGGAIGGVVNVLDDKIPTEVPAEGFRGSIELLGATAARERAGAFSLTGGKGNLAFHIEGARRRAENYRVPHWSAGRVANSHADSATGSFGVSLVGDRGYIGLAYSYRDDTYGLPGHSHEYEACHPHGSSLHCTSHDSGHSHGGDSHDAGHDHGHDSGHGQEHDGGHDHDHGGGHDHEHGSGHDHAHASAAGHALAARSHDSGHAHEHGGSHAHDHGANDAHDHDHAHGNHVATAHLRSKRFDLRGELRDPFAGFEKLRFRAGHTDYRHDEREDGVTGTTFTNRGVDARLELVHRPWNGWRGVVGLQASRSRFASAGVENFMPGTLTRNTGIFLLEEYRLRDWRFELGARYEWQKVSPDNAQRVFDQGAASFSAAANWDFAPQYRASLSLSRSQRLPNAQELYAKGIHLATNTYELGRDDLDRETTHGIDLGLRKYAGDVRFRVNLFHHSTRNYIYAHTLDRHEDFRLIEYRQRDARFTGAEAEVSYRFTKHLTAGVFGDYVHGKLTGGEGNLPRIPAARLGVRANAAWQQWSAHAEFYHVYRQNRVADFEQSTPGYNMLNLGVAYHGRVGQTDYQLYLRGTNLLNRLAYNHASFISRQAPVQGRSVMAGVRVDF